MNRTTDKHESPFPGLSYSQKDVALRRMTVVRLDREFVSGFRMMLPLCIGVVPFGLAYSVSADAAGLSLLETQLMSLTVFAGAAQLTAAGLFAAGAAPLAIVLTTFVINLRHLLYSLTLSYRSAFSWPQRLVGAQFLTDEAFGVTVSSGQYGYRFLLGAELSLYAFWNISTFAGSIAGQVVPSLDSFGIDIIFPLAFLALLVPLLRRPLDWGVALIAGVLGPLATGLMPAGLAVLAVGVLSAFLGASLSRDTDFETSPAAAGLEASK